jgi:antitoxin (DNA-binding transcriptional repressor) of toxin-antitoxin stability system
MTALTTVGVREFRENLGRYLAEVKNGAAIAITSHGKTVAELRAPMASRNRPEPRFGGLKGKIWIADDFDESDDDFETAFYGES